MKAIQFYRDYREFLNDWYLAKKKNKNGYSFARFSEEAGLKSPNYLKLILVGERHLTLDSIQSFATVLKLNDLELIYFEALVCENEATTVLAKKYYLKRLNQLKKTLAVHNPTDIFRSKPNALIQSSVHSAVALLSEGRTVEQSIEKIANELEIAKSAAEGLLKSALHDGSVYQDQSGFCQIQASHSFFTDPSGGSLKQRTFLEEGLQETQKIFESRYPKGAAKFYSLISTLPEGSLQPMFLNMRSDLENRVQKVEVLEGEEVGLYRIQLQVYRMRKNEE